ncbi:MAG: UDP-N-acetylmuramate dehydrogenase [Evtepia sp.]
MDQFTELKQKLAAVGIECRENEPLQKHTTFKIGGPAALMALPKNQTEVSLALKAACELALTPIFLGVGSNLLISDEGIRGFFIKSVAGLALLRVESDGSLFVGSGTVLAKAAVFAMEHGLSGMEFAHGIPGSLGGAIFMNAGAYGGEMKQIVADVTCIDPTGRIETIPADALDFTYRHSVFSKNQAFIIGAHLNLHQAPHLEIQEKMAELSQKRRSKQPLEFPSAGSTFKRPPDHFAGVLIEQCGLKGFQIGGAQISEKHAGFLINTGTATCQDVVDVMDYVRRLVFQKTGIVLEPEIKMLGCALKQIGET